MDRDFYLLTFFEKLLSIKKLNQFIDLLLDEMNSHFTIKSNFFYLINSNNNEYTTNLEKKIYEIYGNERDDDKNLEMLFDEGIIDWSLNEQKVIFLPSDISSEGKSDNFIILPFVQDNVKLGVFIFVANFVIDEIDDIIEAKIANLSHLSSIILQNIIFQEKEQNSIKRQNSLINVGDKIFKLFDLDVLIDYMAEFLKNEFSINKLSIFKKDDDNIYIDLNKKSNHKIISLTSNDIKFVLNYFSDRYKIFFDDSPIINYLSNRMKIRGAITVNHQIVNEDVYLLLIFEDKISINKDDLSWLMIVIEYFFTSIGNAILFRNNKKSKELLESNQKELFKASKMVAVGDLARQVAHEINTPLQVILGRMELLLLKNNNSNISKDIKIIKNETERMIHLVKGLLELSNLKDKIEKFEKIELSSVIENELDFVSPQFEAESIEVKKIGFNEDVYIWGSIHLLKEIFLNLFINTKQAFQHFDRLNKEIVIKLFVENNKVNIVVRDNGPGIPSELINMIFNNYMSYNKKDNGHGIGLHNVKKNIEKQIGTVSVESVINEFTEFNIQFPIFQK